MARKREWYRNAVIETHDGDIIGRVYATIRMGGGWMKELMQTRLEHWSDDSAIAEARTIVDMKMKGEGR